MKDGLILYIVLDDRLSKSQRLPQAVHAVVELQKLLESDRGIWSTSEGEKSPGDESLERYRRWADSDKTAVCLVAPADMLKDLAERDCTCPAYYRPASFYDEVGRHGQILTAVALAPMTREEVKDTWQHHYLKGLKLA
jgi:hypothetical protein